MRRMSRRLALLLVLLVLLPLRGWMGAAMATTMAAAQPVPSAHAAQQSTTASPDCHGHGNADASLSAHGPQSEVGHGPHEPVASSSVPALGQDATHGPSHAQGEGASCAACAFCQLCHTVALAPPLHVLGASWAPASLPLAHLPADLSATTLPGDKPPIA